MTPITAECNNFFSIYTYAFVDLVEGMVKVFHFILDVAQEVTLFQNALGLPAIHQLLQKQQQ